MESLNAPLMADFILGLPTGGRGTHHRDRNAEVKRKGLLTTVVHSNNSHGGCPCVKHVPGWLGGWLASRQLGWRRNRRAAGGDEAGGGEAAATTWLPRFTC